MVAWGLQDDDMTFIRRELVTLLFEYVSRGDAVGIENKRDELAKWGLPIPVISGSLQGIFHMGIRWSLNF
jgi:hypothetical protein